MSSLWYRFLALLREDIAAFLPGSGRLLHKETLIRLLLYLAFLAFALRIFWPDAPVGDRSFLPYPQRKERGKDAIQENRPFEKTPRPGQSDSSNELI